MSSRARRIRPDMAPRPRRALFWQVYPTLLVSLVLVAVLGAVLVHLLGGGPPPAMAVGRPGRRLHFHMFGMLLSVAALVGIAAYPVVARITRRLEALRLSVEAWGGGETRRRADARGGDEIAAVAASFNAAADRAEALLDGHKALLAHASHELRSPLTRLSLAAEMLAGGRQEVELAEVVRREIAELDALVDEILLASRLDHGADLGAAESVDLLALAAEEAARGGVQLREVPPVDGPFEVRGSPRLLRRLIRNLIDNALKHGAPPVEVEIDRLSAPEGRRVRLRVRDHGPGIPEALRGRVFEPFYRPEGWSEEGGGWGLGLSLVRQIAQRHGGRAACGEGAGGATEFEVTLPPASA